MKTTISLRIEEEELGMWKEKAGERTLSEWIREQCNLTAEGQAVVLKTEERVNGEKKRSGGKKLPREPEISVERGGAGVREPVSELCNHDYGPGKCPIPGCKYYKWG
jgi:hypothetical protein